MKYMEILSKVSIVLILVFVIAGVGELVQMNQKAITFYEYQDKKINLKLVKHIVPKVDYIITYDQHILKLKEFSGIKIVSPSEFLRLSL